MGKPLDFHFDRLDGNNFVAKILRHINVR